MSKIDQFEDRELLDLRFAAARLGLTEDELRARLDAEQTITAGGWVARRVASHLCWTFRAQT